MTGSLVVRGDLAGPRQPVVPRRSWEARLAGRRRFGGELGQPGRGWSGPPRGPGWRGARRAPEQVATNTLRSIPPRSLATAPACLRRLGGEMPQRLLAPARLQAGLGEPVVDHSSVGPRAVAACDQGHAGEHRRRPKVQLEDLPGRRHGRGAQLRTAGSASQTDRTSSTSAVGRVSHHLVGVGTCAKQGAWARW